MALDAPGGTNWWEWLGGLVFLAISGLFHFTFKRIGEVQDDMKEDQVEEISALRSEIARMETTFKDRFREGAEDRTEMWRSIQALEKRGNEQHAQNLERLGQIPTRDEMMRMLQQFAQQRPIP